MPSRPRRPVRRPARPLAASHADGASCEWAPLGGPANDGAEVGHPPPSLTLSARTAAEAAHGALRDALRGLSLGHTDGADTVADVAPDGTGRAGAAPAAVEPDRWADEGGSLGRLYAGTRRLSAAERDAWEARVFARDRGHDRVYAAAGDYARALRREGVGLPAVLAAVRATVADDALWLSAAAHAAVQRDAAQCCLEAFYAH
jgi:hypothetical protein